MTNLALNTQNSTPFNTTKLTKTTKHAKRHFWLNERFSPFPDVQGIQRAIVPTP